MVAQGLLTAYANSRKEAGHRTVLQPLQPHHIKLKNHLQMRVT
jgi:hypothetical protein